MTPLPPASDARNAPLSALPRLIVGLSLLALAAHGFAQAARPRGTDCRLAAPPRAAGEIETNGPAWRVYPRAPDIGAAWRGCQTVWAPKPRGGWEIVNIAVVEHREVMSIWPAPPVGQAGACGVEAGGRITGDAQACRALQKSLPAGCLRRRLAAGAMPEDCIAQ